MKLKDLQSMIEGLVSQYGDKVLDLKIYASCDYGDYTHTQQLIALNDATVIKPYETAYSQTGLAVRNEDDEDDEDDEDQGDDDLTGKVIVL